MQFYVFCSIILQTITVILYGKLFILQRIFIYFYGGFFMQSPKRNFPTECGVRAMPSGSLAESFPFYIKECGFCSERKFVPGKQYSYNDYLLLYSIDGTARYTKTKTTVYTQPHSVVMSACNTPLTFTRVSREWNFFYFIIGGSHAKLFYNLVRTQNNIILSNPFVSVLDSCIELYNILYNAEDPARDTWLYLNSSLLIQNIFNTLSELGHNIRKIKELTPAQETVVNMALKYISDNYKNELNIDTICNEISFSKYYFCKIFKRQMGITVHQYVNEFRINKAKELLAYSKLSVNSISTQVGFKTPLTFMRAFERSVHMTPSEYRSYY